jgi:hypothetical protein
MRLTLLHLFPILVACTLACSDSERDTETAVAQPWKATSTHLVLDVAPSFHVNSRFEADREQLRDEQLQALSNVRRRDPAASGLPCGDCDSYLLTVSDADGSSARYASSALPEAQPPIDAVLEVPSLQSFLDSFDCYESTFNPFGTSRDSLPERWETAPVLSSVDSACSHGILHYACEDMRFWLAVEEAAPYRVTVEDCAPDLSLELLGGDMTTLATAAGTASECPVLAYEFAAPGTYALVLHRSPTGPCEEPRGAYYRLSVSEDER